jgi:hypothetical protein
MATLVVDRLTAEQRIRIHERIQQAVALIGEAEDELPHEDESRQELRDLHRRLWVMGYEILDDAKYVPVEELAAIIERLDAEQPFLSGEIDDVDLFDASPRRVAERIHEALHGRAESAQDGADG